MVDYLAPFATIQSLYASRGEPVPANMLPRAEIIAEPAHQDANGNEIAAIDHVPAWHGGLPVPRVLSTFATVYPNLNIANITIAQNGEVERRRQMEKTIQNRNELIKHSFLAKLPLDVMDTMHQAEFQPGHMHISQMDIRQTMSWAMDRFGGVPTEDVTKATQLVYKFFTVSDLINADSLDIAITKRQAILATLKPDARPTYFLIRPELDNAGRGHPAYADLIKFHYTTTAVDDMSFTTFRAAVRAKYNDLVALHYGAIVIWSAKQHDNGSASLAKTDVPNTHRKQAGGGPSISGGGAASNKECHNWMTGQECSDFCKTSGRRTHTPSCKGMCASLKAALEDSRTFNSMSNGDKTAARAAHQRGKEKGQPQGKNPNNRQQPRDSGKGGTIASAPASTNRRYGRASANAASADDDVVSSDED